MMCWGRWRGWIDGRSANLHVPLYGEGYADWVVPRKSLIEGGVLTTTEIDRAIGTMTFTPFSVNLYVDVTRKARDGKVYSPKERIDRIRALKAHTIWGAYYMLREEQLGSLEYALSVADRCLHWRN